MYTILFDILISSILYASVLSLLVPLFKSYYAKFPILSSVILYVLFLGVCVASVFSPISFHSQIPYPWIYQSLLILYSIYLSFRLVMLLINWWKLASEKIYFPKKLRFLERYKETIAQDIHISKKVTLHINKEEESPFTWGLIRPIISFPQLAIEKLSHLQIKSLLLHELVHIKKKDYFTGIILYIIYTIFVFNPFVRWWIREIRFLQEVFCDKRVIKRYSIKEYIDALLLFTKNNKRFSFLKVSVNYDLYNRIALMLGEQKLKLNTHIRYSSLVSFTLLLLLVHHYNPSTDNPVEVVATPTKTESAKVKATPVVRKKISTSTNQIQKPKKTILCAKSAVLDTIKIIDTPSIIVAKTNEYIPPFKTIEDLDFSAKELAQNNEHLYQHISNTTKKFAIPSNIDKDSLITAMVSKITFTLMYYKEIANQYPYVGKVLTSQQIDNIQNNSQSAESIQLLNNFMALAYNTLQSDIENFDWVTLNTKLDNQVVNIILKQQDCQK